MPYGKQKVDNKTAILIIILSVASIAVYSVHFVPLEPKELADKVDNALFTISVSLFGIVFAIMSIKKMNKDLIVAFGLLLGVMASIVAIIPLLLNPNIKLALFFPIYYAGSIAWFLGVNRFVIGTPTNEEKCYALSIMKIMFGYLMWISVAVYPLYFLAISPDNPNSGV